MTTTFEYGDPAAAVVLIQPVDDHDLAFLENEVALIKAMTDVKFRLLAVKVDSWNSALSPWQAPAVFGKDAFAGNADKTLEYILTLCSDTGKTYCIGGYSLAGLFALWAGCQTEVFRGVAAASPSVWFPGFTDYLKDRKIKSKALYLSLGDKESKTRNPVMASVGEKILETHRLLEAQGVPCTLEWNQGNHFKDADKRTAKAFAWVMERMINQAKITE